MSKHEIHSRILDIMNERARATFRGYWRQAVDLTENMIALQLKLGEKSPTFSRVITINGEPRYFSHFDRQGNAVYTKDAGGFLNENAKNATEQRGETGLDRLVREHNIEAAKGAFGNPDELQELVLVRLAPQKMGEYINELLKAAHSDARESAT